MTKNILAICYDFDNTLAVSDMQSFSFVKQIGMTGDEFWKLVDSYAKNNGIDATLCYMLLMIEQSKQHKIEFTKSYLNGLGKDIVLFEGVTTWFKRINDYAKEHNVVVEHYLISGGNKEILESCPIFNEFKAVFASEYLFDKNNIAYWPKRIINYTMKTQCLFRICKNAMDLNDEIKVNQHIDKKRIEFSNMVYIGDGFSDIPSMTLVNDKGGNAIAVYKENNEAYAKKLLKGNRVNHICKSDYTENSKLDKIIKNIIDSVALKQPCYKKVSKK